MKKIKRHYDWAERLSKKLTETRHMPFKYGKHDCCMFAVNIVKELTVQKIDLARGLKGYKSAASAIRILKDKGNSTLYKTIIARAKKYGLEEVSLGKAKRGDLVLGIDMNGEDAAGICVGTKAAFASDGIVYVPMSEIKKVWHYG